MMTNYYKGLKQGLGRGEALRQVQLSMLKRKDRQHPSTGRALFNLASGPTSMGTAEALFFMALGRSISNLITVSSFCLTDGVHSNKSTEILFRFC